MRSAISAALISGYCSRYMAKYHVERFPLEVPAPHARVHEGEGLQIAIADCAIGGSVRRPSFVLRQARM